jgi:threonine/homoserine/homoserine lactone efflux protein
MSSLLVQMAIYGLAAAAAAPIALVLSALILAQSKSPVSSVWVFTAGAAFLDAVVIGVALVVFGAAAIGSGSDASAILDVVLGALFLLLGVSAIFSKESPEKDAKQRERAMRIASAPLPRMFVMGILVQIVNIDAIAVFATGIKEIVAADVSTVQAAVALVFGLTLMLVVYYGPAVAYQLSPARATPMLRGMSEWIMGHARSLEIVTGGGLGLIFLFKGLTVLV